jgi:group I intron endonuclease
MYKKQKMTTVYVIRNRINGKCRVGQTINLRQRLVGYLRDKMLGKTIRKYGMTNFDVFYYTIPYVYGDYLETKLIKEMNSIHPNGYNKNLGNGGRKPKFKKICKIDKQKISSLERQEALRVAHWRQILNESRI